MFPRLPAPQLPPGGHKSPGGESKNWGAHLILVALQLPAVFEAGQVPAVWSKENPQL